jgi:hypothetical protein
VQGLPIPLQQRPQVPTQHCSLVVHLPKFERHEAHLFWSQISLQH